jgi:hypothetical protein
MSQLSVQEQVPVARAFGLLAGFAGESELLEAARGVHEAGYVRFDVFSPYPIHGMDQAMGLGRSHLGWFVLVAAIAGSATAVGLQWFCNALDYPLITQGKPYFSWQAFVPVTFELMVLFAAFAAVIGMLVLNGLPAWYHPTLRYDVFARATDDGFFLAIEADDTKFDREKTRQLLLTLGAQSVTLLEDAEEAGR